MQTETLYGSRGRALLGALVPVGAAVLLFGNMLGDNGMGSFGLLIILGLAAYGIARAGDLYKPRQLVLDREGFVLHPSFGAESEKVRWSDVRSFEIKGNNKNKHLACLYLADDQRTISTMKLGTDWCLKADDLWGVSLDKVETHLSDYHRKAAGQGLPVRSVNRSTTVPSTTVPPFAAPPVISQPAQTAAMTRSGVVYAERMAPTFKPAMPSLNGEGTSLKGLGLGLMGAGIVVAALSVIPFVEACKRGLCSVGFWEMGDYRLWLFASLWTVCLLAIIAGWKLVGSTRSTKL